MATLVGPKGQVAIEKEIRDQLGIEPGWKALQRIVNGHVVIYFVPPEHNRALYGVLAKYAKNARGKTWNEIREAWPQAAASEFALEDQS